MTNGPVVRMFHRFTVTNDVHGMSKQYKPRREEKETAEYNRLLRQFVGWTLFYLGTNFLDKTVFLQYLWHSLIETETNQVVIHPLTTLNITFNLFLIFDFLVSMFPAKTIYNWQKWNAFKVQEWRKESSIVLYTK